ncbi:hypothetical protein [Streptomyces roseoverticillatus]|uniref:hypothetical protein n=1 Tax=Streptomyces roseoverticillatus TaxID=66429 RepID=UPI0004C0D3EF|nr:hypothetical protein [Streptomyces roseoverticillatus]
MLSEDPDLAALRGHPIFKNFEQTAYPNAEPPGDGHALMEHDDRMARYDHQLMRSTAEIMESAWLERGHRAPADIKLLAEWLHSEERIWELLRDVATGRARHWPDRVKLIKAVQKCDPATATQKKYPPRISDSPNDGVRNIDETLKQLAADLAPQDGSIVERSRTWSATLDDAEAAGEISMDKYSTRNLCAHYAAAWLRLRIWMDSGQHLEVFQQAIRHIPEPKRRAAMDPEFIRITISRN